MSGFAARRRWLLVAALVASLALAGCGDGDGGAGGDHAGEHQEEGGDPHADHGSEDSAPAFGEDEATTKIGVTLQDYAFVGLPSSAKGPNVLFEAKVKGGNEHELVVQDASGGTVGALVPFEEGKTKKLAVALQPGTYTIVCLVEEGTKPHADLGMKAELRVE
ncbi:MAG: hypothetical protein KY439_00725 [Actinobacteria bacterium]|nr:hypothetical protein [Actinomycetota bacterium]